MKNKAIKWKTVSVPVAKIKPTPNNYKLKTEDGLARFETSVKEYGLAGAVIINKDFTLIDGNTRLEKAKQLKKQFIDASMPDRQLTPKEFKEFSALFDLARAGEVDVLRIKEELGTTDSFFKKWGLEMPKQALNKLAELEKNERVINPTSSRKIAESAKEIKLRPISLLFTTEESTEYIKLAEALYKQFKVDNVTDLSMKVIRATKRTK